MLVEFVARDIAMELLSSLKTMHHVVEMMSSFINDKQYAFRYVFLLFLFNIVVVVVCIQSNRFTGIK